MQNKHKHSSKFPQGPRPLSDRVMITKVNKQLRSAGWTAQGLWINRMLKHSDTVRKQQVPHKREGKQRVTSLKISLKCKEQVQCTFQQNLNRITTMCVLKHCGPQYAVWWFLHAAPSHTVPVGGDNGPSFAILYVKLWRKPTTAVSRAVSVKAS